MRCFIALLVFSFSHLIFAQKEDSLLLVVDQTEIATLNSSESTLAFFQTIHDLNVNIDNSVTAIMTNFGFNSAMHDSIVGVREEINQHVFNKMREYLSIHPYPKQGPENFNSLPGAIIMMAFNRVAQTSENVDLIKLYFPTLYSAYKEGEIYPGNLWTLLYHLYIQMNGTKYVNLEDGEEAQIEEMINLLDLDRK